MNESVFSFLRRTLFWTLSPSHNVAFRLVWVTNKTLQMGKRRPDVDWVKAEEAQKLYED